MRSTKFMLSGVMLMLLSIFLVLVELGRNSWLSGAAVILLLLLSLVVFVIGLFSKR